MLLRSKQKCMGDDVADVVTPSKAPLFARFSQRHRQRRLPNAFAYSLKRNHPYTIRLSSDGYTLILVTK